MLNEQVATITPDSPSARSPIEKFVEVFPQDYGFIEQPNKKWFLNYEGRKPSKAKIKQIAEEEDIWQQQSLHMIVQDDMPKFFIALKQMGILDSHNQVGFAVGYKGRLVSEIDAPLTSVVFPLIMEVSNMVAYSNTTAAQRDLDEFKKLVNDLEIK